MLTAQELVKRFGMIRHPEGGYYIQTYKSNEIIKAAGLPDRFGGDRPVSTAIYFLLEAGDFSAFHRIKSDECWHFYTGQSLLIYVLNKEGELTVTHLGNDIANSEVFQFVVPAGAWFASEPAPGTIFSFVGCTVSPGFHFDDFELAIAAELATAFPKHKQLVNRLCR